MHTGVDAILLPAAVSKAAVADQLSGCCYEVSLLIFRVNTGREMRHLLVTHRASDQHGPPGSPGPLLWKLAGGHGCTLLSAFQTSTSRVSVVSDYSEITEM